MQRCCLSGARQDFPKALPHPQCVQRHRDGPRPFVPVTHCRLVLNSTPHRRTCKREVGLPVALTTSAGTCTAPGQTAAPCRQRTPHTIAQWYLPFGSPRTSSTPAANNDTYINWCRVYMLTVDHHTRVWPALPDAHRPMHCPLYMHAFNCMCAPCLSPVLC